jgi:hypothetical protein
MEGPFLLELLVRVRGVRREEDGSACCLDLYDDLSRGVAGDLTERHPRNSGIFVGHQGEPRVGHRFANEVHLVVFYRGAWCPYCNLTLRTYQAELVPALADRGFELIAVSPQKPDGSLSSAESNELTYSVASDLQGPFECVPQLLPRSGVSLGLARQRCVGTVGGEQGCDGGNVAVPSHADSDVRIGTEVSVPL